MAKTTGLSQPSLPGLRAALTDLEASLTCRACGNLEKDIGTHVKCGSGLCPKCCITLHSCPHCHQPLEDTDVVRLQTILNTNATAQSRKSDDSDRASLISTAGADPHLVWATVESIIGRADDLPQQAAAAEEHERPSDSEAAGNDDKTDNDDERLVERNSFGGMAYYRGGSGRIGRLRFEKHHHQEEKKEISNEKEPAAVDDSIFDFHSQSSMPNSQDFLLPSSTSKVDDSDKTPASDGQRDSQDESKSQNVSDKKSEETLLADSQDSEQTTTQKMDDPDKTPSDRRDQPPQKEKAALQDASKSAGSDQSVLEEGIDRQLKETALTQPASAKPDDLNHSLADHSKHRQIEASSPQETNNGGESAEGVSLEEKSEQGPRYAMLPPSCSQNLLEQPRTTVSFRVSLEPGKMQPEHEKVSDDSAVTKTPHANKLTEAMPSNRRYVTPGSSVSALAAQLTASAPLGRSTDESQTSVDSYKLPHTEQFDLLLKSSAHSTPFHSARPKVPSFHETHSSQKWDDPSDDSDSHKHESQQTVASSLTAASSEHSHVASPNISSPQIDVAAKTSSADPSLESHYLPHTCDYETLFRPDQSSEKMLVQSSSPAESPAKTKISAPSPPAVSASQAQETEGSVASQLLPHTCDFRGLYPSQHTNIESPRPQGQPASPSNSSPISGVGLAEPGSSARAAKDTLDARESQSSTLLLSPKQSQSPDERSQVISTQMLPSTGDFLPLHRSTPESKQDSQESHHGASQPIPSPGHNTEPSSVATELMPSTCDFKAMLKIQPGAQSSRADTAPIIVFYDENLADPDFDRLERLERHGLCTLVKYPFWSLQQLAADAAESAVPCPTHYVGDSTPRPDPFGAPNDVQVFNRTFEYLCALAIKLSMKSSDWLHACDRVSSLVPADSERYLVWGDSLIYQTVHSVCNGENGEYHWLRDTDWWKTRTGPMTREFSVTLENFCITVVSLDSDRSAIIPQRLDFGTPGIGAEPLRKEKIEILCKLLRGKIVKSVAELDGPNNIVIVPEGSSASAVDDFVNSQQSCRVGRLPGEDITVLEASWLIDSISANCLAPMKAYKIPPKDQEDSPL